MSERLANAPLVEVIFEMRWSLAQMAPNVLVDENYSLLIGRLYDKIGEGNYSYHEKLPTSTMPEEMAGYIIQHRFRTGKDKWPLVQLGPGILTLNETDGYDWADFEKRLNELVKNFLEIYPNKENLKISELNIRYIDAIDYDLFSDNPLTCLKEKIGISTELPNDLFVDTNTDKNPSNLSVSLTFPQKIPEGVSFLRINTGQYNHKKAIIFETGVQSEGNAVPQSLDDISVWIGNAHELTSKWFKKLFKDLMESFNE